MRATGEARRASLGRGRRWALALGVAAVGLVVPGAVAFACVGLTSLTTSAASVAPGATITVNGKEFMTGPPVEIHLDSLTGTVLAMTIVPGSGAMTSQFHVPVTIPAGTSPGPHLLIATQDEHNMNGGTPARAAIYVGVPAPAPPGPVARPTTVMSDSGLGVGILALIGAGAAAASLLVAGAISASGRRRPRPQAVKAS